MGEIFRAHDAVLAREVAVKVLHPNLASDPGFVDRFRREARAAAGLSHPNIVGVHDWGAVDGVYFMVMEFVRGQSLRDVLAAEGLLAPAQAAEVLLQVLAALEHAHRKGIVHRDVKPENVLVTRDGVAKVTDFGLAHAYADARSTQTGTISGTAHYLAPEQLLGEPADPRTDLYSVGIVAFELLTGSAPFNGETSVAIAYKHLRDRVPRPSARNTTVPKGLDGWVGSMTEKDRELRPESATEARRDLAAEAATLPAAPPIQQLVREVPPSSQQRDPGRAPTVVIPRDKSTGQRRRGGWLLGSLLGVLALAAAAWGGWTYLIPHNVDVPRVLGLPVAVATARLADDLEVSVGAGRYSLQVPAGRVMQVQPAPGTVVRAGTTVTLTPSLGPRPVPVPDLVGKTIPAARDLLREAHLALGKRSTRFSDRFPEGRIVGQSEPGTATAPQGSAIDVVLSKGPTPQPVPRVVGRSEEQARHMLTPWVVNEEGEYSDGAPRGQVIAQDPDPRVKLQPGEAVTILVSLGPRFFEVPSFVGETRTEAIAAIQALGLHASIIPVPGSNGDTVRG
ncbi:MAG TPA: Stk1 family PASTA domain-containing Ser/Thr kinase, partial [Actinomycetota bacterium]|nr:Stk1 family PASTA domain-containing Ser/Thr kinase [Actinomycetota bacterium]